MTHYTYYRRTLNHKALVFFIFFKYLCYLVNLFFHLSDTVILKSDFLCLLKCYLVVECYHLTAHEKIFDNS